MNRFIRWAAIGSLLFSIVGCGSGEGGYVPTPPSDTTVQINGKSYPCKALDAAGDECNENFQMAFNAWGDNLDAYLNSDTLGALWKPKKGEAFSETAAVLGLVACAFALEGEDLAAFMYYVRDKMITEPDSMVQPLWFEASRTLCPTMFVRSQTQSPS